MFNPLKALFAAKPATQPLQKEAAVERYLGRMNSLPDFDETLRRLGIRRHELAGLTRDEEVAQAIDTRRDAVTATPWRLEPNQPRASKWLSAEIAPHIDVLIHATIEAVMYGYSMIEITYANRDGRIGIASLQTKPMEWFEPRRDAEGRQAWWARLPGGQEFECDPRKFFHVVRNPTYRTPQGDALLSRLWWPVYFKREGLKQWNRFLETFGAPIVVGKVNGYAKFVEAMQAQGVRSVIGWQPSGPDETVTTINASTPGEFERLQSAMNSAIQKLILGQTLTSQVGSTGSFAAAKVHNEVRTDKRNADIRLASGLIQRVIDQLAALNSMQAPEFVMADDTGIEMDRATRDALLVEKGVLKLTPEYLLDRYDYREGDFEIPQNAEIPPQNPPAKPAKLGALSFSADDPRTFTTGQQAVEAQVFEAMDHTGQPIPLDLIRDAIAGAEDADDLQSRLAVLLSQQDPDFADLLTRAQFAASVLGYVNATERVH